MTDIGIGITISDSIVVRPKRVAIFIDPNEDYLTFQGETITFQGVPLEW